MSIPWYLWVWLLTPAVLYVVFFFYDLFYLTPLEHELERSLHPERHVKTGDKPEHL